MPAHCPSRCPYPRVGSALSLLKGHSVLTPVQQIFASANVGQVIASVADSGTLLPIRIHLRQDGESLASLIAKQMERHHAAHADAPQETVDALAKIDVMERLMRQSHTLPMLAERAAQLGVQGVKFLDPHVGNILLDDRGHPNFVDIISSGKAAVDPASVASRASAYVAQLQKDLLEDFSAIAPLREVGVRERFCATKRQFEDALERAVATVTPLIADRGSRIYQQSPVFAQTQDVAAVSLTDSPRQLLEQLHRLSERVAGGSTSPSR